MAQTNPRVKTPASGASQVAHSAIGLAPGTRLGHYVIQRKLGEGGMGEVYQAIDERLQRPVAIKIPPAELTGDEYARKRFEWEAQAASALNHPNIVTIYE